MVINKIGTANQLKINTNRSHAFNSSIPFAQGEQMAKDAQEDKVEISTKAKEQKNKGEEVVAEKTESSETTKTAKSKSEEAETSEETESPKKVKAKKQEVEESDDEDSEEEETKDSKRHEATTGKKWGVGIASACITGLGQLINGETGKGFAFFGGSVVAAIVITQVAKVNRALGGILTLAGMAIPIWSIVDAVKNAKSDKD